MRSTCLFVLSCVGCAPIAAIPTGTIPAPPPRPPRIEEGDLLRDLGALGERVCIEAAEAVVRGCSGAQPSNVLDNCAQRYATLDATSCDATFGDLVNVLLEEEEGCSFDACGAFRLQRCGGGVEPTFELLHGPSPWSPLWSNGPFDASIEVSGPSGTLAPEAFDFARFGDTMVWRPSAKLPPGDYMATLSVCDVPQTSISFNTTHEQIAVGTYALERGGIVLYPSGEHALVDLGPVLEFVVEPGGSVAGPFTADFSGVRFSGAIRAALVSDHVWVDVFGVLDPGPNPCTYRDVDCVQCPDSNHEDCIPFGITGIRAALSQPESQ